MSWSMEIKHKGARILITDPKPWPPILDWWDTQRIRWSSTYFRVSSNGREQGLYLSEELRVRIVRRRIGS